ncbi:MAG: hypothetical protein ABSH37_14000 [Bryobacteraceae bacterium]|jgi:hypothetical protein
MIDFRWHGTARQAKEAVQVRSVMAKLVTAAFVIGAVWCCAAASAQVPSISTQQVPGGRAEAYFAGQIRVGSDVSPIENKIFSCIPVVSFLGSIKKGDVLAAQVSADQAWNVDYYQGVKIVAAQLKIGDQYVDFFRLGTVNKKMVFPANLTAKVAMKSGVVIHSDGYEVKAARSVHVGDSIPVIVVDAAILSAEAAAGPKGVTGANPWFTAFKELQSRDDAAAIAAWRIVRAHVGL